MKRMLFNIFVHVAIELERKMNTIAFSKKKYSTIHTCTLTHTYNSSTGSHFK